MSAFLIENNDLFEDSRKLKSGLGAVAWASLEMLKRGGMPPEEVKKVQEYMNTYFANPSNTECNTILRVLEKRLQEDQEEKGVWYS